MTSSNNKYLLGVDIGSGSLKSSLVSQDGRVLAASAQDLETKYPHPGWSEQDPEDWFAALCQTLRGVLKQSGLAARDIASICFSATTHTAVLLDRDDQVLRPAILWTDQRSMAEVAQLNKEYEARILEIGFNKANPTWTLPQLLWVKNNEPEIFSRIARVMPAKDYLRHRLTGTWESDYIDAQGTLLLDARTKEWSPELCGLIGLPLSTLPPLVAPSRVVGGLTPEAAALTGLAQGTPVVAGTSDTAAEDYGVGAVEPGQGIIKLATAGNANVMTAVPQPDPLLLNYIHVVPGLWYTAAATNSCASAHRWLRDNFFEADMARARALGKSAFEIMDALAGEIRPGCEGLLFHPYLLGERTPYWDPLLRADFIGLTMRHTKGHLVRALYEGVAFSLMDCLKALTAKDAGLAMAEVRIIGGGAKSPLWRQIVSDVTGLNVLKTAEDDASFGAALIGGVGVGLFSDEKQAVAKCVRVKSETKPDPAAHDKYLALFDIYKQAQAALAGINHQLSGF